MIETPMYGHLHFARGYLIKPKAKLPALEGWAQHRQAGYVFRIHPDADLHVQETERGDTWVLLGPTHDPWKGEHDESVLLTWRGAVFCHGGQALLNTLGRLSCRFSHLNSPKNQLRKRAERSSFTPYCF